jgi:hypothetical protein
MRPFYQWGTGYLRGGHFNRTKNGKTAMSEPDILDFFLIRGYTNIYYIVMGLFNH